MVEAPARGWPVVMRFQAGRRSGTGFTPRCSAKYLSSNRTVVSMSAGEISRSGVQTRYFWSRVSVTRRTLPLRSHTRVEKSIPSSKGGFGNASQTAASAIATNTKRRSHPRSGGLQTADEATAVWKPPLLEFAGARFTFRYPKSLCHADLPAQASRFHIAIVHRFREDRRHRELPAIARLDLVGELERFRRHRREEHGAIFPDLDVIHVLDRRNPGRQ